MARLFKAKKSGRFKKKYMPIGIIAGTLIASAIQGIFGIGSTLASNAYNSPVAQKRRLRKAGLPLSYMYRGNVATQSEVPKLSIDPTLGVEKKLSLDNQTKLVNAQTNKLNIENAIQDGIRQWLQDEGKTDEDGVFRTNQDYNLEIDQLEKKAEAFIKRHENVLKGIQQVVETRLLAEGVTLNERRQGLELIKQRIVNLGKQAGLLDQLEDIRDFEEWLNSTVTDNINSLPHWAQAITATVLKLASYK